MTNPTAPAFTLHDGITGVSGFQVASAAAGLKASGALDVALIVSDRPCAAAGVFTTNRVKAAPVQVDQAVLAANPAGIRAVFVNTRCANASTGTVGLERARATIGLVAGALGVPEDSVLVMSTGVIGTQLPMDRIAHGVSRTAGALGHDWASAAAAIMTTDTRPKAASATVQLTGGPVTIAGIAKGAGMIAPNMATMLSTIVTDAALTPDAAGHLLRAAAEPTFNRIVVDGDMSTNDTVLILASGASGVAVATEADRAAFEAALTAVCRVLAQAVVRDGEGVTKFISLHVTGAASEADARRIANTIATSALVKTAFYGGDANWGRIVAAAGRAGADFEPDTAHLWIATGEHDHATAVTEGGLLLFADGIPTGYDEAAATAIMVAASISVHLACGRGTAAALVWTCDLSHDYVSVNGHYRS
jgi:glutamate N-acetyltransferase/amino-acid N-acetyltransferase